MVQYELACRRVLVPAFGALPLGEITRADVLAMHAAHAETPAKANQAVVIGRMVWSFAEDLEVVGSSRNPFARVRPHATVKRRNPIGADEGREVWRVCEDALRRPERSKPCSPVHAAYFGTLLLTGLRMREGTSLRHEDFDGSAITLHHHKTARKHGRKVIELSSAAAAHLQRIQRFGWDPVWLFPSKKARSGHIEDPWRPWQRVCEAAGVYGTTLHDLRRGFASAMLDAGHELRVVQDLLGHASITTTAKYARPGREIQVRAADSAAAAFVSGDETRLDLDRALVLAESEARVAAAKRRLRERGGR